MVAPAGPTRLLRSRSGSPVAPEVLTVPGRN